MELVERLRHLSSKMKDWGHPEYRGTCTEAADLLEEALKALEKSNQVLSDLLVRDAHDLFADEEVEAANTRIWSVGTIGYITEATDQNNAILTKSQGEKIDG